MRRTWPVWALATLLVVAGLALLLPSLSPDTAPVPQAAGPTSIGAQGPEPPDTSTSSGASTRTTAGRSSCRAGEPKRLVVPALGVDAPFERIGLDPDGARDAAGRAPLGNPGNRKNAGWYADGPKPGSGRGTVLTNGHTYRNGSAIFREDFSERVQAGQVVQLRLDNGSLCSYRISKVWREVDSARGYPQLVASQHLYDFGGPERLLLATCSGSWNAASQAYDDISVVLALPVTAP